MIRVLIADDQAMVRQGFGALLAAQPDLLVVGDAADGAQAVAEARRLDPDVVLMDVRMPVLDLAEFFSPADVAADDALQAELAALREDLAPAWL
ncbi:response regulator, partial [Micromonospora sp. NPDC051296]|uniref:response regulator transcription factor n=1 Tax=Micromonospora sp. NPDC051296 TaxID=3155046 RepID=UPI0034469D68